LEAKELPFEGSAIQCKELKDVLRQLVQSQDPLETEHKSADTNEQKALQVSEQKIVQATGPAIQSVCIVEPTQIERVNVFRFCVIQTHPDSSVMRHQISFDERRDNYEFLVKKLDTIPGYTPLIYETHNKNAYEIKKITWEFYGKRIVELNCNYVARPETLRQIQVQEEDRKQKNLKTRFAVLETVVYGVLFVWVICFLVK